MNIHISGSFLIADEYENKELIDQSVVDLFQQGCRVINQKATLAANQPKNKILKTGPHLRMSENTVLPYLKQLKVYAIALAKKYILDYGAKGLPEIFEGLRKNKINHAGVRNNLSGAIQPLTLQKGGLRIATPNFCQKIDWSIGEGDKGRANPFDVINNVEQTRIAKDKRDKVLFSVIIPVFNDAAYLKRVLDALEAQSFSTCEFEVIVVDNGSIDNTIEVASRYQWVQLLTENKYPGSPYSCRNRGIEASKGEYIIFLDATCIPTKTWLQEFKAAFDQTGADIVGGGVSFLFSSEKPTAAEYYDSVSNIQMKKSIEQRSVAKTANLGVRREVIDQLGMFEEGVRSGRDVIWTGKAVSFGYRLIYWENARVYKPARKFRDLIRKQWRVSKAQPSIWSENMGSVSLPKLLKRFFVAFVKSFVRFFWVLSSLFFKRLFSGNNKKSPCKNEILGMAFIPSCIKVMMHIGNIFGYFKK